MMTLGSLFDGIGGFPLAAVHCGGVPVWASEIEPFPMRVTKLRFPDMIHVGDITKLDGAACGCNLRRQPLSGFVSSRITERIGRGALRSVYGPGTHSKGDESRG